MTETERAERAIDIELLAYPRMLSRTKIVLANSRDAIRASQAAISASDALLRRIRDVGLRL